MSSSRIIIWVKSFLRVFRFRVRSKLIFGEYKRIEYWIARRLEKGIDEGEQDLG